MAFKTDSTRFATYMLQSMTVAQPGQQALAGPGLMRHPLIFLVSRDREWVIWQAYGEGRTVGTNTHYSCLHTRPVWLDIPPGEERSVTGKLYFLKGGPEDLLARWKDDFGRQTNTGRGPSNLVAVRPSAAASGT